METTLHRQLKELYAGPNDAAQEVTLCGYRIDVTIGRELIEIQHAGLAAIRDKIARLLRNHPVRVVKPIVRRKLLVKLDGRDGREIQRRQSPKQGGWLDLFDDLVYFTKVFPHKRLMLEVLLIDVEEIRYPGHGRRRRWRQTDFLVQDRVLTKVVQTRRFQTAADLLDLFPPELPERFDSAELALGLGVRRWTAQRIAYCCRQTGAIESVGKRGNSLLYRATGTAA